MKRFLPPFAVPDPNFGKLKIYAERSITAGNEHLKEARELLAKLKM